MEEIGEGVWGHLSWWSSLFQDLLWVVCLYELELFPLFHLLALTSSNYTIQEHLLLLHQSLNLAQLFGLIQTTRQAHGFEVKIEENTFGRFQNILHHQHCPPQDQVQGPPGDRL